MTHGGRGAACLAVGLLAAGGVVAACARAGSAAGGAPATGAVTPTAVAPATAAVPATAAPASGPSPSRILKSGTPASAVRSPAPCRYTDVRITRGGTDAGLGHRAVVVVFTNTSERRCQMRGYPGVGALVPGGANRVTVVQAAHTLRGYLGGLGTDRRIPVVTLAPGQAASAMLEAFVANRDGSACVPYRVVYVSAPGEVVTVTLPWGSDGCATLEVHPVVPGTSGRVV